MSEPIRFLTSFAQALSAMGLYQDGHPARGRAVDAAYEDLVALQKYTASPSFTFLGDEVVFGKVPLRELRTWDWSARLANAGIQRLEFEEDVTREDFEDFLEHALGMLSAAGVDTSEIRQFKRTSIKFGPVGVKGDAELGEGGSLPTATMKFSLGDEAETVRWMHEEVKSRTTLPLAEAEAVVRSLSVAMHGDRQMIMPLLQLKEFDQYTTTHSLNVSVLSMALAEYIGMGATDARAFGVAGLLHDLGKVRIPIEVLTKSGKLTPDERVLMNRHPSEGARIILESEEELDLAAVVAYEHHIMLNGGGYPRLLFQRPCHYASNLVHVCDVYDALRTRRPYRDAWSVDQVLPYLEGRAGMEFDPELTRPFVEMMRKWESHVAVLHDEQSEVPLGATPPADPAASQVPTG